LIDDQDIVDSVTTSNANGTWKQGRHILRQSVLHTSMIGIWLYIMRSFIACSTVMWSLSCVMLMWRHLYTISVCRSLSVHYWCCVATLLWFIICFCRLVVGSSF